MNKPDVQTIEKTAKRWKAMQAVGVVIFLMGSVMIAVGDSAQSLVGGALIIIVGVSVHGYAKLCAWWYHG